MTAVPTSAPRGRRSSRPSGDDREQAILRTAERLLEDRPLADISVDDLARGAGISRPTFYFYFPSKEAVLLSLLDAIAAEADAALQRLVDAPPAELAALWRTGIEVFVETFRSHRAVARAAAAVKFTNAEVRRLWSEFMRKWVAHTTAVIEAERSYGAAPVTLPAEDLSTALNLLNEMVLAAAFAGEEPAVPDDRILDTLTHIWTSTIYAPRS
ncbi:TetR/AcrR family transcriptional regulator [Mycobacterium sp. MYCO198283]|uniref:TetR/AcrR family transcriptional regulator n=1 Tax=Mycobacterium sp. MYCO198283 TaxID=2883505 RepID=UPI001E3A2577|nr:TetR/AcrR family transcriptional regulator [Mycobacterium sp. MYCO198283]MCG5433026.1 TetR/AcrR family transcriptional regulator [Mycobacterium sp. MYCO198283]